MEKALFHNRARSFLLIALFGIIGGALVGFFEQYPHDNLWAFALFGSMTFGFWMCTTSLIVLFSEKFYTAGINAFLYVAFMFYVTGIFKHLVLVSKGFQEWTDFWHSFADFRQYAYAILPGAVCFALGMVLWFGRKKNVIFVILRFLPALFILGEAIILWSRVISQGTGLFMAIIDTVCCILYLIIILKSSIWEKENETTGGNI